MKINKIVFVFSIMFAIVSMSAAQVSPSYQNCEIINILNGTTNGNGIVFVLVNNGTTNTVFNFPASDKNTYATILAAKSNGNKITFWGDANFHWVSEYLSWEPSGWHMISQGIKALQVNQ